MAIVSNTTGGLDPSGNLKAVLFGASNASPSIQAAPADGFAGTTSVPVFAYQYAQASGALWNGLRTPNIVKTVSATALGDTALWTPTAGKKFRIMRLIFDLTANVSLAAAAVEVITLRDATTDLLITFSVFVPTAAVLTTEGGYTSGWIDLGNGLLSALANNVLNVNLGTALATGVCRVTCCGTEE